MPADLVGERTLHGLLAERVAMHPERVFLICEDRDGGVAVWTYGEFAAETAALAAGLAERGVGHGSKVVALLPNGPAFVMLWFALARLGAVLVPVNTASTAGELTGFVERSDAVALVADAMLTGTAHAVPPSLLRLVVRGEAQGWERLEDCVRPVAASGAIPAAPDPAVVRAEDPVEFLFTSGTTARPKAVMLTHANCLHSGERVARTVMLREGERCLTALPLYHVNAQSFTVLAALTVGGTAIVLETYRASRHWARIRAHGATQTSMVAMQLRTLLAQPPHPGDRDHSLRRVVYAINVPDSQKAAFEERFGVELLNGYGLTEAMTMVTLAPVFGPKRWPSIGLPAAGRVVRIVGEDGRELPAGEVGEIQVAGVPGRTLMLGYYQDPEATAEVLSNGWLSTGDTGRMDEQGYLYFFDRRKDIIKRAGENVSASEVERVLMEHPAVAEAAVIAVPDPIRDEAVKAFVVRGGPLEEDALLAYCRERLSAFKVPTVVEFLDALPKTSVGKIEKAALRAGRVS